MRSRIVTRGVCEPQFDPTTAARIRSRDDTFRIKRRRAALAALGGRDRRGGDRVQTPALGVSAGRIRVELANAIFDYTEIFYNRQCHHSSLSYRTPIEFELLSEKTPITAASWPPPLEPIWWGRSLAPHPRPGRGFRFPATAAPGCGLAAAKGHYASWVRDCPRFG